MDGWMTYSVTNSYPGLAPGELLLNKAEGVEILSIIFLYPTLGKQLLWYKELWRRTTRTQNSTFLRRLEKHSLLSRMHDPTLAQIQASFMSKRLLLEQKNFSPRSLSLCSWQRHSLEFSVFTHSPPSVSEVIEHWPEESSVLDCLKI